MEISKKVYMDKLKKEKHLLFPILSKIMVWKCKTSEPTKRKSQKRNLTLCSKQLILTFLLKNSQESCFNNQIQTGI